MIGSFILLKIIIPQLPPDKWRKDNKDNEEVMPRTGIITEDYFEEDELHQAIGKNVYITTRA